MLKNYSQIANYTNIENERVCLRTNHDFNLSIVLGHTCTYVHKINSTFTPHVKSSTLFLFSVAFYFFIFFSTAYLQRLCIKNVTVLFKLPTEVLLSDISRKTDPSIFQDKGLSKNIYETVISMLNTLFKE